MEDKEKLEDIMFVYFKNDFSSLHAAPARYANFVVNQSHPTLRFFCYGNEIEDSIKRLKQQLVTMQYAFDKRDKKRKLVA